MQVDLYHVVSNSHMAEGLFAYVPKDRLVVQGDFFDVGWELYWWQNTYADNIAYRNLQVDTDVPVHGRVVPMTQVFHRTSGMNDAGRRVRAQTSSAAFVIRWMSCITCVIGTTRPCTGTSVSTCRCR